MKDSIGVLSLGCPRNLVDSEAIIGRLARKGCRVVDMDKADIAIVNTCAFIDDAKRESIDAILDLIELKKEGRVKKIIVYGCLAQRYKDELIKGLPGVDAFVGRVSLNHGQDRFPIAPRHFVYLKICEGCINSCSFCIIPKIKGRPSSLDECSILEKVRQFNSERVSELNIIGQDITGFGMDLCGRSMLMGMLRKITREAMNIGWVRLLYLYPSRISDELLAVIKDEPKICKYIDLPIQHANDRILRLMNRHTTKRQIIELIVKIRKAIPDVALRTSVITGFPSETDEDFKELLGFIKEFEFERLGAFTYSAQEGTPAATLKGQVPDGIKRERFKQIMSLQQDVSKRINERFLGKTLEVLIDEGTGASYLGRTQFDAPEVDGLVYVNSRSRLKPGDFVKVKITDTLEYDLLGEAI